MRSRVDKTALISVLGLDKTYKLVKLYGPSSKLANFRPMNSTKIIVGHLPKDTEIREIFNFFVVAGPIFNIFMFESTDEKSIDEGICIIQYKHCKFAFRAAYMFFGKKFRDHIVSISHVITVREGWFIRQYQKPILRPSKPLTNIDVKPVLNMRMASDGCDVLFLKPVHNETKMPENGAANINKSKAWVIADRKIGNGLYKALVLQIVSPFLRK